MYIIIIIFFFTAQKHVEPYIKPIALELLNIIRETENDDLTNVMQKIVCTYTKQLTPIAVEMTQHLVRFLKFYGAFNFFLNHPKSLIFCCIF